MNERFAYIQQMVFAKTLREHGVEFENYKANRGIKRQLDSEIGSSSREVLRANRALGLPEDNYELFPEKLYVARKLRAGASIAATFNTTGTAATFNAVHAYLQSKTAAQVESERRIQPGDYIDLPAITVAGTTVTDQPITKAPFEGYEGRLLRLIVVGVNSFNGKNGNGTSAHLVFQFQNVAFEHPMNPATEKDKYGTVKGGYRDSAMRAYILGDFLPGLIAAGVPESILWGPKRMVWNEVGAKDAAEISDKLWLPTEWEIFGGNTWTSTISSTYETEENQARFAYYDDYDVRLKYNSSSDRSSRYWLASIDERLHARSFLYTDRGHHVGTGNPDFIWGCVPAFCVR
ncbi:hypothetical protein AGMMS49579_25920 [Spirochaetia bacterium]|nr:hypothetical protein AGMMS49579_25920 [Spirochaetia bacterium]